MGDRKYEVKVSRRKQFRSPGIEPSLLRQDLTLGTMPVAAGVVGVLFESAIPALLHMAAKGLGAAAFDAPHYLYMREGKMVFVKVRLAVIPEDIRHFKAWPLRLRE